MNRPLRLDEEDLHEPLEARAPRLFFCCLLAVLGAALVARGANLQGFVWWVLVCFVLGTVCEGDAPQTMNQRLVNATVIAFFFFLAAVGLYVLLGIGLSQANSPDYGMTPEAIRRRWQAVLDGVGVIYVVIGLFTALAIVLASGSTAYVVKRWLQFHNLPEASFKSVRQQMAVLSAIGSAVVALVAYFAAG